MWVWCVRFCLWGVWVFVGAVRVGLARVFCVFGDNVCCFCFSYDWFGWGTVGASVGVCVKMRGGCLLVEVYRVVVLVVCC